MFAGHLLRYHKYEELRAILCSLAQEFPDLVRLESIGESHEGRDIWSLTVSSFAHGEDFEKPALWVDGGIHASELATSTACLYLVSQLVSKYGSDPRITACLNRGVFYVCPRVSPDGAELVLAERPRLVRSSTRLYPQTEVGTGDLVVEDIDGDGRILMMRLPDPHGAWKASEADCRLLVPREPVESGGCYFRLLPESRVQGCEGPPARLRLPKQRLDLNRNFPADWKQEYRQPGSGPYPLSEPEARAIASFVACHRNIVGAVSFHTFGGVLLRAFAAQPERSLPFKDLLLYEQIGEMGAKLTGYPCTTAATSHYSHPAPAGMFPEWLYDHYGVLAWGVELWSPQRQAGITDYSFFDWNHTHPVDHDLQLLRWSDQVLGGRGYVDWYPFDHPQFGRVELGGWDAIHGLRNPPPELLEREIAPFVDWLVWQLLAAPHLEITNVGFQLVAEGVCCVSATIQNTGWWPTYVTQLALEKDLVSGVECEIELPSGATIEGGQAVQDLGQLEGRVQQRPATSAHFYPDTFADRIRVEWFVRATENVVARVIARHERAGVAQADVPLFLSQPHVQASGDLKEMQDRRTLGT
ncbi:MAG: M14 family metallopeptidase [Anaerolineae bacterium]